MRLLVCEFITGGGLLNEPLPQSLAREGELMLTALLADLTAADVVEHIDILRDPRLAPINHDKVTCLPVNLDFMRTFAGCCDSVDAVLPIAPESGRALLRLTRLVEDKNRQLLSSRSTAVTLAGSKRQTIDTLSQQDLAVIPAYSLQQARDSHHHDWVIKPDDGVGGAGCRLLHALPQRLTQNELLQPYVEGRAASLTLLCNAGQARLVAVNEQYIDLDEQGCQLRGVYVNGMLSQLDEQQLKELQTLASAVAVAIPDLWGWVGVDFIYDESGARILEINPRLTTAYCGLHDSLQQNPAAWLLELAATGTMPDINLNRVRPVEVLP